MQPNPFGVVSGEKYYDANANGQLDPGEVGIAGWKIDWTDGASGTFTTAADGSFSGTFTADTYTFAEKHPNGPTTWMQTGEVAPSQAIHDWWGKRDTERRQDLHGRDRRQPNSVGTQFRQPLSWCRRRLTLGFWSNKNGQALETATDFTLLSGLNLVNANGSAHDFTSTLANNKKDLNSWLLNATATNMAYMLSAQLAAMELNVAHSFVNGNALIYAPGTTSANALGFATVNAVMAEGNSLLIAPGNVTVAASALRTQEEAVKTALDKANNNLNFVEPDAAHCPTPVFPSS